MEACTVTGDQEKPEWVTAGTMAEGRSFLGSAALGGKVLYFTLYISVIHPDIDLLQAVKVIQPFQCLFSFSIELTNTFDLCIYVITI